MYEELGKGGGGGHGGGHGGGGHHGGGHGGHHGGHGHHGGGRRRGGFGPGWWGGGWDYGYPSELVVIDEGCDERTLVYVMSLPKNQRHEAYVRLCGRLPPPGALGAFDMETVTKYALPVAAVGAAVWVLFLRKKRRR